MDGMNPMIFVTSSPERLARSNPFGDAEAVSVDLGKEVNVTQLADEIRALAGFPVMVASAKSDDPVLVSKLYVTPVVSEKLIVQAVKDHEPDDLYGMNAVQRERYELMRKLSSGDELSEEETRRALSLTLASG